MTYDVFTVDNNLRWKYIFLNSEKFKYWSPHPPTFYSKIGLRRQKDVGNESRVTWMRLYFWVVEFSFWNRKDRMINNGENKVVNFPDTLNETDLSPTVRQAVGLSRIPSERIGHTVVPYHQTAMLIGGEVRKQFWFLNRKEISILSF